MFYLFFIFFMIFINFLIIFMQILIFVRFLKAGNALANAFVFIPSRHWYIGLARPQGEKHR